MIPLSDVLARAIDRKRNARALYGAQLMHIWPQTIEELVSDQASMGSRVECLRGTTLVVRTASAPLANELRLFAPEIVKKLNQRVKLRVVARIVFRL